jgi:uncharacterized membrane protein YjfL (UPF0719 family)
MFSVNILDILINTTIIVSVLYMINKIYKLENQNIGFRIRKSSFILGFSIAILSSFISSGTHQVWYMNIVLLCVEIVAVILALYISLKLNDKFILRGIDNSKFIDSQNISVSIVEAGTTISTAILLLSSFLGEGTYLSAIIFFILGQISLFLMIYIYNSITEFEILELIKQDNKSMAIVLFSITVGFSILLSTNIYGDSIDNQLLNEIGIYILSFVLYSIVLFLFLNKFLDKIFFKQYSIEEEIKNDSISNIILYSVVKLSIIILIAFIVHSSL